MVPAEHVKPSPEHAPPSATSPAGTHTLSDGFTFMHCVPAPHELTVVVCTRNRAGMLAAALESITAAVPQGVEVLVVDSASDTAETREVAEAAGVGFVRSDVKGLSIARNLGLATSTRPIVLYTDDDCVAVEGWITPVLAGFDDPEVGAVTGRMLDHTLVGGDATPAPPRRYGRTLEGLDAAAV